MRRSLFAAFPEVALPANVRIRQFDPTRDIDGWLTCNAAAFVDHPEQGRWTNSDLANRMKEPWFSTEGFLVAVDDHDLIVGFHWTKIHGRSHHTDHEHEAIGEVYVVGVLPTMQGHGLGKALTIAGLKHLRNQSLTSAMLYVDVADERAIALYKNLGFAHWDTDTLFREVNK